MSDFNNTTVAIIGGGLTGLTTAFYLQKHHIDFVLLEKEPRFGGVIRSIHENGFLYECGPNTGVLGNPELAELFEDLGDKCKISLADPAAKKRLIWKNYTWNALPSGPFSAITTPLFSFWDKLRVLGEPFRKKVDNPLESVADMVKRRLGKSFLDYAIDPFIAGIYAGDPNYLVTKYALPKMHKLEANYGSLVRGGMKKSKENKKDPRQSKASREVFSAENGLQSLIDVLVSSLNSDKLINNAQQVSIQKDNSDYIIQYRKDSEQLIKCQYVITTTGAYTLPSLLSFIQPSVLKPITSLKYNKVVLVLAGYNKWLGSDIKAFGGLVPSKEARKILGILFTSSFFVGRAPKGGALLSVFMGGSRFPEVYQMSDKVIEEMVLDELKITLNVDQKPDLLKVIKYEHAIAQYGADSKERLETIDHIEYKHQGLYLAGNIRDGIGMADRIKQGRDMADTISTQIKNTKYKDE